MNIRSNTQPTISQQFQNPSHDAPGLNKIYQSPEVEAQKTERAGRMYVCMLE